MHWVFRKATSNDKNTIEALFVEMLQSIYQRESVAGYEDGYLDKFFSEAEDWICVAEMNREVIAYLSIEVHREAEEYLYLDDFCVSQAYRSQGIGTKLIKMAESFAEKTGISKIVLHVEKTNISAQKLYERLGFTMVADEGNRNKLVKQI